MISAAFAQSTQGLRPQPGVRQGASRRRSALVLAASTRLPPSSTKQKEAPSGPGEVVTVATTLALTGASIGTYMDGIHSRVEVLVYDKLPLTHGGLHSSAYVPPLLAAYYLVLGGLLLKADSLLLERGDEATEAAYQRCSLGTMCLSFGAVAAVLQLSSMLYEGSVPAEQMSWVLAGCAAATYLAFDGTKQGLALAALCAVACPAAELMLMHIFQLWHYPRADLFTEIPHSGIPSWVPWCYFVYTTAVAQLSRYLKKAM